MICYTRNFEDVILQRVFADVPKGSYIDVGASMPVVDSNTYALYQKGWRGVAIEPIPEPYPQAWQQARPEDVFLSAAVGQNMGQLTLQIYDHARQISSGSAETVAHWQRCNGPAPSRSVDVSLLTLDHVIAEYLPDIPLHLISIDVEGMEDAVLKGLDLKTHRPWVIVVEAVLPGMPIASHQGWEPCLLESGYSMAYFDGVNRFYLAQEKSGLLERFALPPNVWDNFQMAQQIELQNRVTELSGEIAELRAGLMGQSSNRDTPSTAPLQAYGVSALFSVIGEFSLMLVLCMITGAATWTIFEFVHAAGVAGVLLVMTWAFFFLITRALSRLGRVRPGVSLTMTAFFVVLAGSVYFRHY